MVNPAIIVYKIIKLFLTITVYKSSRRKNVQDKKSLQFHAQFPCFSPTFQTTYFLKILTLYLFLPWHSTCLLFLCIVILCSWHWLIHLTHSIFGKCPLHSHVFRKVMSYVEKRPLPFSPQTLHIDQNKWNSIGNTKET